MSGQLLQQMPKFFITDYDLLIGNTAYILGEDARHLKKSLRIKDGDSIIVCDGLGKDYIAKVEGMENDAVLVRLSEEFQKNGEPTLNVNLYTAITKGEGFEYAIRKCIEAGVHSINPIITERTVVNIPDSKINKKAERWNKIAEEAAKQSGRSLIPNVAFPRKIETVLETINPDELSIICYVEEDTLTLKEVFNKNTNSKLINIFIGPEGGFTENEWKMAVSKGAFSVTLGKRILKAETAGLFVTAAAMYEYGELDIK